MALYIIIMGVQGAGKGVQAGIISERYRIPQVSTGDLFRAMRSRSDDLARQTQEIMAAGNLVPDDLTNKMVRERLEQADAAEGVILDGYPRNIAQAQWLSEYLGSRGESLRTVLLLQLDLYVAFKRAFGRVRSDASGKLYNLFYDNEGIDWHYENHPEDTFPPRVVGTEKASAAPLQRRPDDANAGAIIKRIDTYLETTMPLVDYFRSVGLLTEIDAAKSIEAVSRQIQEKIVQSG
jgi:adenylate kinase